jgi:homocitrate synthase
MSNRLNIVESTLREGEQFADAHFTTEQKLEIAALLDEFGVDCLELTSPVASPQSAADLRQVCETRPRARVLTHTRCDMRDVEVAIACGVDGVNVLFATSEALRPHSHGRSVAEMIDQACTVVEYVRSEGREIRFTCEDTFRTPLDRLIEIMSAVDKVQPHRLGLADTVGVATPSQVYNVVSAVHAAVNADLEFHGHNDTGCAIANALSAFEGEASYIDTTVLGIGERNGIASLSGLMARLMTVAPEVTERYNLEMLPRIDSLVSEILGIPIPFNAPITGAAAFAHKAGMHTKAVLADPTSYEVINPERVGRSREILIGHRLVGRNAIRARASELNITLDDDQLRRATNAVKSRADGGPVDLSEIDEMLRSAAFVASN